MVLAFIAAESALNALYAEGENPVTDEMLRQATYDRAQDQLLADLSSTNDTLLSEQRNAEKALKRAKTDTESAEARAELDRISADKRVVELRVVDLVKKAPPTQALDSAETAAMRAVQAAINARNDPALKPLMVNVLQEHLNRVPKNSRTYREVKARIDILQNRFPLSW